MRRLRNRGPSSSELIRQSRIRNLLCKYGSYSRPLCLTSSCSSSGALSVVNRSSQLTSASSAYQLASTRRAGQVLHEDADVKLSISRPSQLVQSRDIGQMDKGLALAAAQYVSRVLSNGDTNSVDGQRMKEDFLHQLERDWGFTGADNLSLGRVRITIKRRDNDLENMLRRAELERAELEKSRLEARAVQSSRKVQSTAVSSTQVSSTTKVVKTRVVKTSKRTVQTVRAA